MGIRKALFVLGASCLGAHALTAQQVRGEVRDSATGRPVAGAIVMVLDSMGRPLVRNLTSETGRYFVPLPAGSQRLRVVRIGFKPREMALAGLTDASVDVALAPIPTFLQTVDVTAAAGCPVRADRAQALSLYEQARAGLLATVVAREANPARMVLYTFTRRMDGTSDRIKHQSVQVDSSARAKVSFVAGQNVRHLVANGFVADVGAEKAFFGPDADVLLSEEFASAYCFALAKPSRDRPNELGLAFAAAERRRDRVDIEGALWIDTLARAIRDVEFQFVGLGRRIEILEPGGHIEFREMPNGAVLVDRWKLRLIGTTMDSVAMTGTEVSVQQYRVLVDYYAAESGGELAHARWPDGRTWNASLGRLRVRATNAKGEPAIGAEFWLDDTPYRGSTDSAGVVEFRDLVPGPYALVAADSALDEVGVRIPTAVSFTAVRDSVHSVRLRAPTAADFIFGRCARDKRSPRDATRLLVRAMTYTDEPIDGVNVKVSRRLGKVFESGKTGTDGMFQVCNGRLEPGTQLALIATRDGWFDVAEDVTVTGNVTVVRLVMAPRP